MEYPRYYTLVTSLPHLVHFEAATRLPITRLRLTQRLSMLSESHARQLAVAEALVTWHRQPVTRTDEEVAHSYRRALAQIEDPSLREFIIWRMDQRTVIVALRRRRLGLGPPRDGGVWGVGPWVRRIEAGFDDPSFRLGAVYPWVEAAREHIEKDEALALERLLMREAWTQLTRLAERSTFGFERVFAFLFKWDITQRWLSYEAPAAQLGFEALIAEVMHGYEQVFDA